VAGDGDRAADRSRAGPAGVAGVGRGRLGPRSARVAGHRGGRLDALDVAAVAAVRRDIGDGVAAGDVADADPAVAADAHLALGVACPAGAGQGAVAAVATETAFGTDVGVVGDIAGVARGRLGVGPCPRVGLAHGAADRGG